MADADQVLTAGVSVLVGYGGKMAQDWWTARRARLQADRALWSLHKQQFHLPLLGSARELETRRALTPAQPCAGPRARSRPSRIRSSPKAYSFP
jgi:hypothetical protein